MNGLLLIAALTMSAEPAAEAPEVETEGAVAIGVGLAFTVTSMAAFNAGFEAERQLRAGEVKGVEANDALALRTAAAFVAWPSAVLAIAGLVGGGWLLGQDGAP